MSGRVWAVRVPPVVFQCRLQKLEFLQWHPGVGRNQLSFSSGFPVWGCFNYVFPMVFQCTLQYSLGGPVVSQCTLGQPVAFQWHSSVHWTSQCTLAQGKGNWFIITYQAHVIIIMKSEISTFPVVIIFFRGCVSEMFVPSYYVTYCMYIPGKPGICLHYHCAVDDKCKTSHYHHCANLSEDRELIKCPSDIFCPVCELDKAYSLSYPLYNTWGCVFSIYPFPLWWLREYIYFVLSSSPNRKYEVLPIV